MQIWEFIKKKTTTTWLLFSSILGRSEKGKQTFFFFRPYDGVYVPCG